MKPPLSLQQNFWNHWNATTREVHLDEVSFRQAAVVTSWLSQIDSTNLRILEVGCGSGWFCGQLAAYGNVTATDLSDQVLGRARTRLPSVKFVAGDFMQLDFGLEEFDVIVTLEVLSHVEDQAAFVAKIAALLRKGGQLMLATQNGPVLRRYNRIPPPGPGQLRLWVDRDELTTLLSKDFEVMELFSVTPRANKGILRILHSRTVNRPIRAFVGRRFERFVESLDLGWTLMARAKKRRPVPG
ncbi:class I SAM-dependent methyltransferase [Phyllobacterium endophyticum]|uniref:Class I SAM-dependent methyltransferase n=1 Tax=Phyllobacterium endophyticum TaxID=1149773 RepID=A0A2P7AUT3_9HYPH|nr:class I SAM-dependent methyltransferase [Phyllobacterium endophyticum]MBB3234479.1 2-polyprenyl-3-methyl-5-hydroxy-6-metoxy-1,4-benzoquinol methylase [Phyllobacterium endophyticum]PSH57978.1 class I SAM-dependent methyltransferase [Phyllobacterium endophyticum]TYR39502.1 class I SAM-dependent methyltransferase [Phyllobacterium endophyticum]